MSFHFDKFHVRAVTEADRAYLDQVIAGDPLHRWNMTADFFLKRLPGEDAWAIEDDHGKVVLYFKTQTAIRFSCIFTAAETRHDKATNARVLRAGWEWLKRLLARNGYREVICDTQSPELELFTRKVLGFYKLPDQLSRLTPAALTTGQPEKSWERFPEPERMAR